MKSNLATCLRNDNTEFCILVRKILFTPGEQDHGIQYEGKYQVKEYSANHDEQSLPGWLGSEFIRLRWQFHLLLVHRFVNHSGDFDVTTQRQPSDSVFSLPFLGLEDRKPGIEEEIKFFHPAVEKLGEDEMSEFVQDNQYGEAQNKLSCFDQYYHFLCINCLIASLQDDFFRVQTGCFVGFEVILQLRMPDERNPLHNQLVYFGNVRKRDLFV